VNADWLQERVVRLGRETLDVIGESRLVAETTRTTRSQPGYPSLGAAAFLAWAALEDENDPGAALAAEIVTRYMAEAPVLRLPRPAYRLGLRLPHRLRAMWLPGAAISAGATLGWVILALDGKVSDALRRQMSRSLTRCYDDVRRISQLGFYINGNYQVALCELAYLYALVNGSDAGHEEYERCLAFLCNPEHTNPRWRGHGFQLVQIPARPDWHDAIGYFSEVEGANSPEAGAFDAEYVQLQLDYLLRLWLLTRDHRILRLSNALINSILPLADQTTWLIDCRGGSRRNNVNPFWNAGLATLALHDPRPEFTMDMVESQFTVAIEHEYSRRAEDGDIHPYCLRGYGLTLLGILVASSAILFDRTQRS
jgi:hypothetical protein